MVGVVGVVGAAAFFDNCPSDESDEIIYIGLYIYHLILTQFSTIHKA
jgi:hypothetical protein